MTTISKNEAVNEAEYENFDRGRFPFHIALESQLTRVWTTFQEGQIAWQYPPAETTVITHVRIRAGSDPSMFDWDFIAGIAKHCDDVHDKRITYRHGRDRVNDKRLDMSTFALILEVPPADQYRWVAYIAIKYPSLGRHLTLRPVPHDTSAETDPAYRDKEIISEPRTPAEVAAFCEVVIDPLMLFT